MEWDLERQEEKSKEIQSNVESFLREMGHTEEALGTTTREFLESAINISPPEKDRAIIHMVTMAPSGRGGGQSSKPGNIKLNMRTLIDAVSSGVFTAVSVTQIPWAIPFAAIMLWNSICRNLQVALSEAEAVTLWVMWQVRDANDNVKLEDIKPAVDRHSEKYQRQTLSKLDINHALNNLHKIGCIEPAKSAVNKWWLREWVSASYK